MTRPPAPMRLACASVSRTSVIAAKYTTPTRGRTRSVAHPAASGPKTKETALPAQGCGMRSYPRADPREQAGALLASSGAYRPEGMRPLNRSPFVASSFCRVISHNPALAAHEPCHTGYLLNSPSGARRFRINPPLERCDSVMQADRPLRRFAVCREELSVPEAARQRVLGLRGGQSWQISHVRFPTLIPNRQTHNPRVADPDGGKHTQHHDRLARPAASWRGRTTRGLHRAQHHSGGPARLACSSGTARAAA
jgi:hypothetical protein